MKPVAEDRPHVQMHKAQTTSKDIKEVLIQDTQVVVSYLQKRSNRHTISHGKQHEWGKRTRNETPKQKR